MPTNNGYTLIETLVVIIIIGVLAAIAIPTYAEFVTKAKHAKALPVIRSVMQAQIVSISVSGRFIDQFEKLNIEYPIEDSDFSYSVRNTVTYSEITAQSKNPLVSSIRGCVALKQQLLYIGRTLPECD